MTKYVRAARHFEINFSIVPGMILDIEYCCLSHHIYNIDVFKETCITFSFHMSSKISSDKDVVPCIPSFKCDTFMVTVLIFTYFFAS